ncbi:MAG: UDP-N-acetylmuramate dehydrogenase [Chloroherpetonaceae bacterium]|nr:UDP-N-acetylmuramate dehydrogenase [Chloroherpetonaceae bacterium]
MPRLKPKGVSMVSLEEMRKAIRGEILIAENLAKYSSYRIGGNADFFIKPLDKQDVLSAVSFFQKSGIQYVVLGRGSNVLISDEGIRGAVISLRENLEKVEVESEDEEHIYFYVEAGVDLPELAAKTLKKGYGGLENLSGVPGSIGGAVLMNAGAYGKEIFEVIEWVEVLRNGKIEKLHKSKIAYRYRGTDLGNDIILSTKLKLKKLKESELKIAIEKKKEWMEKRRSSQPLNLPNAGSVFKNPPPDSEGNPRFAGVMIEACGLKGLQRGGAQISEKHANFLVNANASAKASEMLELIDIAKREVFQKFRVSLELEIKLLGFSQNALKAQENSFGQTAGNQTSYLEV